MTHKILLLLLLICSSASAIARSYLVQPQWYVGKSEFREAYIDEKGELVDLYTYMDSDTVNVFDTGGGNFYDLDLSVELYNFRNKPYAKYAQYYKDENGVVKKARRRIEKPVYGWVWGMRDMQHYNAVLMRGTETESAIYMPNDVEYCIVTVNGTDTVWHTQWAPCHYDNRQSSMVSNRFWLQYRNNTAWIGGGYNMDIPWSIVYNVPCFGSLTGLYLGSAAQVGVNNAIITVNAKELPPRTTWTEELLKAHFSSQKANLIEGFYKVTSEVLRNEELKMGGDYRLAVVADSSGYEIIYLSGAKLYPGMWKSGMVKGRLQPLSWGGYELSWYDAEGQYLQKLQAVYSRNVLELDFGEYNAWLYLSRENIGVDNQIPRGGTGSGFAVREDGYIITNHHVIDGAKEIRVHSTDGRYPNDMQAEVIASDSIIDLALLRIVDERFKGFGKLPYGFYTYEAKKGESVFYLGYPKPKKLGEEIKTSIGHITAENSFTAALYMISIDVDHGSSGSPMFNEDGNIVGIIMGAVDGKLNMKANLAIKASYLYRFMKKCLPDFTPQPVENLKELPYSEKVSTIAPYVFLIKRD